MSLRTTRQRTVTINDNQREMTPMATEDRQSSQTSRTLWESRTRRREETHQQSLFLRIIKYIALCLIALCVCAGAVLSKVSLVSITGRMFYLSKSDPDDDPTPRSVLFIQLTFMLVVPEVVSFVSCLVRGVIGKTTKSFPWPTWKALVLGVATSIVEVLTLCAFVFGVACKLPPSLTILILNGCFLYPIGRYLVHQVMNHKQRHLNHRNYESNQSHRNGYASLPGSDEQHTQTEENLENGQEQQTDQQMSKKYLKYVCIVLEISGLVLQLGALVGVPIVLSKFFSPSGAVKNRIVATYILIPVSLFIISFIWSGWTQSYTIKSSDGNSNARYKTGLITSALKILLIPFASYGYAVLLLDLEADLHPDNFHWNDLELSIFLTHVIVSYLTYFFAWIACSLQSWAFFVPMLLSTPVSYAWYVGSVEGHEIFPFIGEYFVEWTLNYIVFIIACFLWISEVLLFGYYIFQKSENVLTSDADLFWMPRYNSVFLEQHMMLNRKVVISGSDAIESNINIYKHKHVFSRDNFIFICSTMYHESEFEMRQMLKSIDRMATADIHNDRNNKFESHIFFDGACSGKQLNEWAMQLLGLLEDTLGIKDINRPKVITPYGIQLHYTVRGKLPFYIHFKDNHKVKNKKRWSQVMYMKYILEYRIKKSEKPEDSDITKENAFILTTDADIYFTSGSVTALLDILARDDKVGAVCARTHPLGSGPVVWYQVFDYAIGHWFQKAAEHVLGCVLCCPGCFSVFRVEALDSALHSADTTEESVLKTYSSGVDNGFDFLTKDMGEDRWLCTLLIKAGWRLEYSAVSEDSTYCPDSFEEFFKQRRRWVPSTIANLALVISDWYKITSNNDSITILFILYQFLIVFSSLISPATVILVIVSGLQALDDSLNEVVLILVLGVISILYGVICMYATEKTQLDIAKLLTIVFSVLMAVVMSGILSSIVNDLVDDEKRRHGNHTVHHYQFPVDVSALYTGIFAVAFIIAGIFHFNEFFYLFHSIWYLLCLPSGYLLLIIYSVCNLNNRSWGTREGARPKSQSNSGGWLDYFTMKWYSFVDFMSKCIRRRRCPWAAEPSSTKDPMEDEVGTNNPLIPDTKLNTDVKDWLRKHKCEKLYAEIFEREGYTKMDFIATMKTEDFLAIGVDRRGFLLKLEKEVKKLPTPQFETKVPENVLQWLKSLRLEEYEALFESEGYFSDEDVENLKGLTKKNLRGMGITKRAHLNQLMMGLRYLQYPTAIDIRINQTRASMNEVDVCEMKDVVPDKNEVEFWDQLANTTLKPESANLGKVEELKEKLTNLRNLSVLILLLINVMWIVFLYTLKFPELIKYGLPDKAFSLLFLIIFSVIMVIQFVAMIFHRFETLLHLLAGIRSKDNTASQWTANTDFVDVSLAQSTF